jgi:hypothetical protein
MEVNGVLGSLMKSEHRLWPSFPHNAVARQMAGRSLEAKYEATRTK